MLHFQQISVQTFLNEYWQKKPLVIRNALPNFISPLSPDELAGLALEEEVESRIVKEMPNEAKPWHLTRGPFSEKDFQALPETHWTLLVQGVDRLIPEVYELLEHFDFIPQWRIDDVMISYASKYGSVGPHYDNYDVFLFQALGSRKWSLTSQGCTPENYIPNLELRIMKEFKTEEQFVLEEGDMLYLPAHIGHYGIAFSDDCMTYSFGYRSYSGQELLDSLSDYVAEKAVFKTLYRDPDWSRLKNTSQIQAPAWQQAQKLLEEVIHDEELMSSWFACFATRLDQQAEQQLPEPVDEDEVSLELFLEELAESGVLIRNACCRWAYINAQNLYINGYAWDTKEVAEGLVYLLANKRCVSLKSLEPFLNERANQLFLFELWKLQWIEI
ncbi:cupin domain-containing protein [Legionella sp. km772]|uniref:cupin domain-containing protein n=1 Tax=Legionella sp. km772 TaxID=2498111 RepID=UPI000F8EEE0F|nr:cupin domain-containing protein [Legionella sp. km772]RUR06740.1 cupin domain-containing protein [Legionella sp. km772]